MKKGSAKLPLKAMSIAMNNFAERKCMDAGLTKTKTNKIMTGVSYEEPYMNMEVFKTGKIYASARKTGNKILSNIALQAEDD